MDSRKLLISALLILFFGLSTHAQELLQVDDDNQLYLKKDYEFDDVSKSDLFELVQYWFKETLTEEYDSIRSVEPDEGVVTGVISTYYPIRNREETFLNFIKVTAYDNYISIYMDDMRTYYGETPLEQYLLKTDGKIKDRDMAYEVEGNLIVMLNGIRNYIEDNLW